MTTFEFACGGSQLTGYPGAKRQSMSLKEDVNLRITDISSRLVANVPDLLLDLLEISAYVYCADQRAHRGSLLLTEAGSSWHRNLVFSIPVRRPGFWQSRVVNDCLVETLQFLSDDTFAFEFEESAHPPPPDAYFPEVSSWEGDVDEIQLFSGGIDSLAGAVEAVLIERKRTVLVGHHSATKVLGVQRELVKRLSQTPTAKPLHIPVNVTNSGVAAVESTQRTRSFLFASIAFVLARMLSKDRFSFFENGVVSFNLPLTGDVLGARATRTTHPLAIGNLENLFSILAAQQFEIGTPYLWNTKTEVVARILQADAADLLPQSVSCSKPRQWEKNTKHCGVCSQCIDRRFAMIAAGAGGLEPQTFYSVDLIKGIRHRDEDLRMAVAYVKHCQRLAALDREEFPTEFPQVYAAVDAVPETSTDDAIRQAWELHQRHAKSVLSVLRTAVAENAQSLAEGKVPARSLLAHCLAKTRIIAAPSIDFQEAINAFVDNLEAPKPEFAVDAANKTMVFAGGLSLQGADFRLVDVLLPNHRSGKSVATDVNYMSPGMLAKKLGVHDEAMRQRITRVRKLTKDHLAVALGISLSEDGFIENLHGKGYRIAPVFKEVALGDLSFQSDRASQIPSRYLTNAASID